jgi:hypothetical protein
MIGWVALVLGLAVVVLAILGFRKALRLNIRRWQRVAVWSGSVLAGGALALTLSYPIDEGTRVYGFPLPAAAFQKDASGAWLDFVGPFTTPFMLLNWVALTGVVLYGACALAARRATTQQRQGPEHGA